MFANYYTVVRDQDSSSLFTPGRPRFTRRNMTNLCQAPPTVTEENEKWRYKQTKKK